MSAGSSTLNHAIKTLRMKWEQAKETWDDGVRRDFEAKHIVPLESQVNATLRGMDRLDEVLAKMRRDCG